MGSQAAGTALITGASGGIGAAFARQLAFRGHDLILVARRLDRLEALAAEVRQQHGVGVEVIVADLSRPADLERVGREIARIEGLGLLINNAGFGTVGYFAEIDLKKQLEMIQLHLVAGVRLTRAVLPGMISAKRGAIINVSSPAAFIPTPGNATYSGTKAFLNTFSEALAAEQRGSGVRVQVLVPGFTHTGFYETAEYMRVGMKSKVQSRIPGAMWMSADELVAASLASLERGRLLCAPGFANRLMVVLGRMGLAPLISRVLVAGFRDELRGSRVGGERKEVKQ